ncbi:MAG TPA: protein kinase, partial [Gemmatimonadales bacterium]|nr:protein kinase [Gemmatimonadales bacterium]
MPELLSRLQTALAARYRLDREIGSGGMATVYLAQDLRHARAVALKVLRPELAAVIGAERFLAEITLTANLQHPHILPLFDSGEADSYLFYVMPFVQGETLRDRLSREKQLPVADALRIAGEVASALDYAHRHDVVHRDIKPENILLHDGSALVADFGIALAASKASGARMTETGMSLGTPHYMSPEQAMGEREITARSDVYALGAVLYEMLTGEPPFTGNTAQAVVARVLTESPRSLGTQRHTIPRNVEAAVLTALEKLPADRFATAAEFADAVDYAHERGVIHRDIKPANILLVRGEPLIADFGIALAVSAAAGGRMTETGLSLGTPHYMSPEQATADREITARSDVYSLASVLYEMLAGSPPHLGGSAQQVIMRIIADTPRSLVELRKSVPPNVAAAVAKALEKLPADRVPSARAFAEALADERFAHVGATPRPGTRKAEVRGVHGRLVLAGGAALALVGILAAGLSWRLRDAEARWPALELTLDVEGTNPDLARFGVSPDGAVFAFATDEGIAIRDAGQRSFR